MQQILHQDVCEDNNLVGIEESFVNLTQATADYRAAVTDLTDANMNLTTPVSEHANNMAIKDTEISIIQKTTSQLQGYIKTLKCKLSVQATKKLDTYGYKKVNWWIKLYLCMH